ncbi:MAG: hypothetical protein GTO51_06225 [Candidatus Latescibacteria bacterium]|nr:hypothetical protein [Candidatus Latescibacterota bacterium]NIM21387.1 hypothetical protein [Candidatus Latescibacterota bacterium]NIM65568.1 hypothetical protein [Candidatus Latescibacterota bacterium]NIO01948.1 hypothetical protein [Candidatus Latescibacterota bacterium]NIO28761.1 hypothetical protein [Candidatus Latescibacterota bacterium]
MAERKKAKYWAAFIGVAILIHFALLITIKPSFFSLFKKTISPGETGSMPSFSGADAIITIPIEIEEDIPERVESETPQEKTQQEVANKDVPSGPVSFPDDLDNLLGEGAAPIDRDLGPRPVVVPPRPVEITWPDTRKLRICIGSSINVNIQVGENGEILQVRAEEKYLPPQCIHAALEAAGKIVFIPGNINGIAAKMWTRVRMDFKRDTER